MQKGEWMPVLIDEAPPYLKQDIMSYLYSYHLRRHFLFMNTHTDFLRQLVVHMKRSVYLPNNYIVEKGDVDSTMYFIHRGEVGAFDSREGVEVQCFMLSTNMSFGEAQGLHRVPFPLSYKALTVVEVLALKRSRWEYLLQFFPASREELTVKSQEYGLLEALTYSTMEN